MMPNMQLKKCMIRKWKDTDLQWSPLARKKAVEDDLDHVTEAAAIVVDTVPLLLPAHHQAPHLLLPPARLLR